MSVTTAEMARLVKKLGHPLRFAKLCWPQVQFYDKEREVIESLADNDETFVYAGNMLGKDFVAGFLALCFFLSPKLFNPRARNGETRIITTSVKDDHLRVLWGEIGRFIQSSRIPLTRDAGGPLIVNFRDLRKIDNGQECKISYCRGMVSEKGEGMAGHHAESTFAIIDEASGVDDLVYTQIGTWARKILVFGNPNPCENFFRKARKQGDLAAGLNGVS